MKVVLKLSTAQSVMAGVAVSGVAMHTLAVSYGTAIDISGQTISIDYDGNIDPVVLDVLKQIDQLENFDVLERSESIHEMRWYETHDQFIARILDETAQRTELNIKKYESAKPKKAKKSFLRFGYYYVY